MKKILKIAKTELQNLFYSPVAWLVLVIFSFQVSSIFTEALKSMGDRVSLGASVFGLNIYGFGLQSMQGYLYFYLPLLTMGLMSKEFNTGSIKLLFSSPISNTQIILGKYLAIIIYGFLLMLLILVFLPFGLYAMPGVEAPIVLCGIFGMYLLICAYAAIGLFMSSLTSYQVVAAMGTLALFAGLNFMGNIGQTIPFVRDITYWLSLSGRTEFFFNGLLSSEDILYFLIVIAMFLAITVIKLRSGRKTQSALVRTGMYSGVIITGMFLGYLTSRPVMKSYYDLTKTKSNTLTPGSQDIIKRLKGGLSITTFVNIFDERNYLEAIPSAVNRDQDRFMQYLRFKPEIKMKYVYYYDDANYPLSSDNKLASLSPAARAKQVCETRDIDFDEVLSPEQLRKIVDLNPEQYRFTRLLERESGEKTFLRIFNDPMRHPSEREITAAFKRVAMKLPKVGFVQGDGERDIINSGDRGYYNLVGNITSRSALINQGFEKEAVDLSNVEPISSDISILVIADMNKEISAAAKEKLNQYISRGGNLIIAGDVGRQPLMNPLIEQFGVQFLPGQLIQQNTNDLPNIIGANVTQFANQLSPNFDTFITYEGKLSMPGACALSYSTGKGYSIQPVFVSDSSGSWNELETKDFIDETPVLNSSIGESENPLPTALALSRKVGTKTQKIMILGDADCLSNADLNRSRKDFYAVNFALVNGMFHWMSDGEVPIDVSRPLPDDNKFILSLNGVFYAKIFFMGVLPFLLALAGTIIWVRRRNR